MGQHTAGGWNRNIKPASKYSCIFAGRNTHVAYLATSGLPEDEIEANCNLIAAAPDLLAALESFVEDVRVAYIGIQEPEMVDHSALMHEWPDLVRSFHVARAAIAAAKGAQ